jgi:hypothetical protein
VDGRDGLTDPFREPVEAPLPPRLKPGKKQAADVFAGWTEEVIGEMVAAGFAGIAVVTKRDHWARDAKEVAPITKPLANIIAKLPPDVLKRMEKHSDAIALIGGCVAVAWPSILTEAYYAQGLKERQIALQQQQQPGRTAVPAPADFSRLGRNGSHAPAEVGTDGAAAAPTGTNLSGLLGSR